MLTNFCVPLCKKKDKQDKVTGEMIHFFRFPEDENTRKRWLHAIRRDVGPYFSITHGTSVCSSVMADKGFTIEYILPLGVTLNILPFLGMSDQMSNEDVVATAEIASLRIHIKRAINKIKNLKIFDGVIPFIHLGVLNQMWCVCPMLCNLQNPIISA